MDAMYPRVLTETGTVGVVAFFILIIAVFRMGWSAYRQAQDPFQQGVAMGFLLGFMGLLVHAVGANSFIIVRIMEPFWLVAALVAKGLTISQATQQSETEQKARTAIPVQGEARTTRPAVVRPSWAEHRSR
mgnify:CR=1 FL=1